MADRPGGFTIARPSSRLSAFVDFFWSYDCYDPPPSGERVLPTGTMELLFIRECGGDIASGIAGPRSQATQLEPRRRFEIVAVHFKPGGGFPFFGAPACELHNVNLPLDLAWGGSSDSLANRLWELDTPAERFRLLETALMERSQGRLHHHPAIECGLKLFEASQGARRVDEVIDHIGISRRRFVDLFQSEVGLSPKTFCRVRRFNAVLSRIERLLDVDWADIALACGYFDQAHFNHDFRAFAGVAPSEYLRKRLARIHVAAD
jgi:AraC-like DNA-binding protein